MGVIAGAGIVSHAPVVIFPEQARIAANGGRDFSLVAGLRRLRVEVFEATDYDTVVVFDTHWATTTDVVITAADRRTGRLTSDEMPAAIHGLAYDLPGDRELADTVAERVAARGLWMSAIDDPALPIHYATVIPWTYLGEPGKAWVSVSVCQTATTDDHLEVGAAVAEAVAGLDRRVVLVASGGLSHTFWPLRQLRERMAGDPANIVSDEHRAADLARIEWLRAGQHARVIDGMPDYLRFDPEARFGHYLMLAGALGGRNCTLPARQFGEYENAIGTGQAHLWCGAPT